jgi:single-stranded-DNA-specific exonuclease
VRSHGETKAISSYFARQDWILDWRGHDLILDVADVVKLQACPTRWDEVQVGVQGAIATERKLALAYHSPDSPTPQAIWKQLIGIAKYLSRTQKTVILAQLTAKLNINQPTLHLGFAALAALGFEICQDSQEIRMSGTPTGVVDGSKLQEFESAIAEEQFRRQYFYEVPVDTLEAVIAQNVIIPGDFDGAPR